MQGPFRGVAGALARTFGGTVTIHPGTPQARDVTAIFRKVPFRTPAADGAEIESLVPTLRASREVMADLTEGDLIDPKDGQIYRFLFEQASSSPASDALITAELEEMP